MIAIEVIENGLALADVILASYRRETALYTTYPNGELPVLDLIRDIAVWQVVREQSVSIAAKLGARNAASHFRTRIGMSRLRR